jgi:tetratricopeptide (TPR) repeat protein
MVRGEPPRSRGGRSGEERRSGASGKRAGASGKRSGSSAQRAGAPRSTSPQTARPQRGRSTAGSYRRDDLPDNERSAVQAAYDGPPIPDDITGEELDRDVRNALKSLPEKLAARVARHLVAAARLLDSDPGTAYQHAQAARARAARVSLVRDACGETAYAAGKFREALAEFQAGRRLSGSPVYLPMMADCERALNRPERALALARSPAAQKLDTAGQIEMLIVESGARRDLGDLEAALRVLDVRLLHSSARSPEVARLRYAYADTLFAAGREQTSHEWFQRAAAADALGSTDAAERVAELEGLIVVDALTADSHIDDEERRDH